MSSYRRGIALVLGALLAAGITIVVVDNGPDHPGKPRRTVTVTLGGPGHAKVPLTPAAQAIEAQQHKEDASGDVAAAESELHETSTTQLPTPAEMKASKRMKPAEQPVVPLHVPAASPSVPGCVTKPVQNYSSRRGAPVLLGVIHWTGSRSIPGSTADGLAIVRWFDQPASSASSSEITDDDGSCWLVVPEFFKPWTQVAFNSWSVSDEHVNPGAGPLFTHPAGRDAVVRLVRGWHHRWHLPYRLAAVTQKGCRVVRTGYIDHHHLGACGGGHPDVGSYDIRILLRLAQAGDEPSRADRVRCRKLNWWRRAGRPHGGKPEANAVRRREVLAKHGWVCSSQGPVPA